MQKSATYARQEDGGARLDKGIDGATGAKSETEKSSSRTSRIRRGDTAATTAGRLCQRQFPTEALSPAHWQTPRLPGENSSISARMACRSSEAEITGNNRTNTHPRAQRNTSGRTDGLFAESSARGPETTEQLRRRHNNHAGSNRESQQRLRKSSIRNAFVSQTEETQNTS